MPADDFDLSRQHLEKVRAFYDAAPVRPTRASSRYRAMLAHYYNLLISPESSVLEIGCGSGELLGRLHARRKVGIDLSERQIAAARTHVPQAEFHVQAGEALELSERFDYIIISETLNFAADVQQLLQKLHGVADADTRLIINYFSALWRPFFSLGRRLKLKHPDPESSWLATSDVLNFLRLADWEALQIQPRILLPFRCAGLEQVVNRWLAPVLRWFCVTVFCVARPLLRDPRQALSVSVIVPARNEAGNIAAAVQRIPPMGAGVEIIFVEGHSRDDTWAKIQQVARENPSQQIKIMQQKGRGKGDAVRLGFAAATGDILMILDADLTMPPEELP